MGVVASRDFFGRKQIDEACSNTSLSKLRYIAVEKPKWKVFGKRELKPVPTYNVRNGKGCHCGNAGPCKQIVTPKGVTIHYPQKNIIDRFGKKYKPPKIEQPFLTDTNRVVNKVKIVRPKKFAIPTFRLDKITTLSPFQNGINKRRRRGRYPQRSRDDSPPEGNGSEANDNDIVNDSLINATKSSASNDNESKGKKNSKVKKGKNKNRS